MSLKPHSEQRLARMLYKLSYNFFFQKRTMLRMGHYVPRGFNDDDRLNKRSWRSPFVIFRRFSWNETRKSFILTFLPTGHLCKRCHYNHNYFCECFNLSLLSWCSLQIKQNEYTHITRKWLELIGVRCINIFSKIITFELLYKKTRKTAKRTQHNTFSDKDTKGT